LDYKPDSTTDGADSSTFAPTGLKILTTLVSVPSTLKLPITSKLSVTSVLAFNFISSVPLSKLIAPDKVVSRLPLNLTLPVVTCPASMTVSSVPLIKLIDVTPPAETETPAISTRPVSKLTPNASPTLKLPRLSKL
jgi:hypothetical protein